MDAALDTPASRSLGEALTAARGSAAGVHGLNELLISMRAVGDLSANGAAVSRALQQQVFTGLVDAHGRSAHAVAVETVRTLGPPWSNRLAPEDLAAGTEAAKARGMNSNGVALVACFAIAVGVVVQLLFPGAYVEGVGKKATLSPLLFGSVVGAVAVGAAVLLMFRRR